MEKRVCLVFVMALLLSRCSIHFDLLGRDTIQEVVLVDSKARQKILIIDVSGIVGMTLKPALLERESDLVSRVYYRLKKASEDRNVKGIILRLDTPGGEVTASDIIYNEILRFKEDTGMPVVSLMMGIAASGGYYIASAGDHIIAHPSTITGSIGVISLFPNLQDLFAKIGIDVNVIKSGAMKDSGSAFRDMTEEEKAVFQTVVDALYQKFLDVVLEGRKGALSREKLLSIADGRIYTAGQALSLGLIDEIGYFEKALDSVMSLAGIRDARIISYTYYPKQKTNIYATHLNSPPLLEVKDFQKLFGSLKSGFYYLWLPQIPR